MGKDNYLTFGAVTASGRREHLPGLRPILVYVKQQGVLQKPALGDYSTQHFTRQRPTATVVITLTGRAQSGLHGRSAIGKQKRPPLPLEGPLRDGICRRVTPKRGGLP